MRIAIVTDTHLTPRAPQFAANLAAVLAWAVDQRVDLVVHLGDASADGAHDPSVFAGVRAALAGGPPVRSVPGNHDIGEDRATAAAGTEPAVAPASLAAWRAELGPDYWSFEAAGWRLIGLNSQLFGGADAEDAAQQAWLRTELEKGGARLGVFAHKPLFRDAPHEKGQHQRYAPPAVRATLWRQLRQADMGFFVAGHTHQLRRQIVDGVEVIWAPSAAYRIPDILQEPIGAKVVGAMLLELRDDGFEIVFATPPGVVQHDLGDHLDLYPELRAAIAAKTRP